MNVIGPPLPQVLSSDILTGAEMVAQSPDKDALRAVAHDFEAAFIAQMLTHSGLTESLTSGEGKMAAAFGSFYVEQLAGEIAQSGGFGMADSIYKQLERYDRQAAQASDITGDPE